ncbi:proline-specific peptidase [Mycena maculata]|uniref:Proline-specific peptidase n=1 Tax=Mycena maculata TaxID=230809 RepID=A0AAD7IZD6_9AGAR|nr:proline-specific peptidase [Mycena maculata]
MSSQLVEGKIPFTVGGETFETYYKCVGDIANCTHPLVVLHGGPGISHDYLIPLADLASRSPSTAVIFYDQLGSGQSTRLRSKATSFWTIDLFIDELENVLAFFAIEHFDILGHSWGGTLASEFIVRRTPSGLRRLILANALASARLRNEAISRLRAGLPEDVQATLKKHEGQGTTKSEEYKAAMMVFWAKHGCRLQPFPAEFLHSISLPEEDPTVLEAMRNGEDAGLSTRWDITPKIQLMRHIPTLIINGEYDFMADSVCQPFFWGIDRVKWVKFANSSHTPQWEERERYINVVSVFLEET